MTFTKIQVIKMLRDQVPGLGLKEAKAVVDSYELKWFENRVASALGEEARAELRSWAMVFVNSRNEAFDAIIPVKEYKYTEAEINEYDDGRCDCEECIRYRENEYKYEQEESEYEKEPVKKASEIWCLDTGIEVLDPDGWNRKDYENSWYEEITREEFIKRASMSTCKAWPKPLMDERSNYPKRDWNK